MAAAIASDFMNGVGGLLARQIVAADLDFIAVGVTVIERRGEMVIDRRGRLDPCTLQPLILLSQLAGVAAHEADMIDTGSGRRLVFGFAVVPDDEAVVLVVEAHEGGELVTETNIGPESPSVPFDGAIDILCPQSEMTNLQSVHCAFLPC